MYIIRELSPSLHMSIKEHWLSLHEYSIDITVQLVWNYDSNTETSDDSKIVY